MFSDDVSFVVCEQVSAREYNVYNFLVRLHGIASLRHRGGRETCISEP